MENFDILIYFLPWFSPCRFKSGTPWYMSAASKAFATSPQLTKDDFQRLIGEMQLTLEADKDFVAVGQMLYQIVCIFLGFTGTSLLSSNVSSWQELYGNLADDSQPVKGICESCGVSCRHCRLLQTYE